MSTKKTYGSVPTTITPEPLWTLVVPLLVSLVIAAGGVLIMWLVRHDLPEQIAIHWGADGTADGFSTLRSQMLFTFLFPLGMALPMAALGRGTKTDRIMGPINVGLVAFIVVMIVVSVLAQRGSDPTTARAEGGLWWGLVAGIVAGVAMWLPMRRKPNTFAEATGPLPDGAKTLKVAASTKLVWTGHTRVDRTVWVIAGIGFVPIGIMMVVFAALGNWALALFMGLTGLLVAVLISAVYSRVLIDNRGVRVVGLGFLPWANLPLSNLQGASVAKTSPLGDFGGYGRRYSFTGETEGVVTAEGEAIRITRAGERPFLITVDDAATAAATLNTLILRSRPASFEV